MRGEVSWGVTLKAAPAEFTLAAAAVCRPLCGSSIDAALASPIDWANFLRVIDKHRIATLALDGLVAHTSVLPEQTLAALRQGSMQSALRSVATMREAYRLSEVLSEHGIGAAVLKGPTLSVLAFEDAKLRQCRDIDLLIQPAQVEAAHAVFAASGYRLREDDDPAADALRSYMRHSKHLSYTHRSSGMRAELHWRLYDNPHIGYPDPDPESWQTVDMGFGMHLRTLADDDLLLYLCSHGAGHGWSRLKWLADVSALLHRHPESIPTLIERASASRLGRAVTQALVLSHHVFGTSIPAFHPDLPERILIGVGWDAMIRGDASTELYQERFASTRIRLSQLLLSASPVYLARQIANELSMDENGPSQVTLSARRHPWAKVGTWMKKKLSPH